MRARLAVVRNLRGLRLIRHTCAQNYFIARSEVVNNIVAEFLFRERVDIGIGGIFLVVIINYVVARAAYHLTALTCQLNRIVARSSFYRNIIAVACYFVV